MTRHEGLELPDELVIAAERELGIDPVLDGDEPELVVVCGRGRGKWL
jgi:hypothetical protein